MSEPRVPCAKRALKMGVPTFPKRFLASERVGFYLRVLEEGEVGTGDAIEWVETDPERMSVREFIHLSYFDEANLEGVRKAPRIAALLPDWREWLEEALARSGEVVPQRGVLRVNDRVDRRPEGNRLLRTLTPAAVPAVQRWQDHHRAADRSVQSVR